MKFVGLVGSNYDQSYNRKLLEFIRRYFKLKFELEVLEIDEVPMFNQDEKWDESFQLRYLYNKITRAVVLSLLLLSTTTLSQLHSNLYLNGFHTKFIHLKTSLL